MRGTENLTSAGQRRPSVELTARNAENEIERRAGRTVSRAAVYVTLRRLEEKCLIRSWMGEPRAERGGKAKRCVKVESEGLRLLRESREVMDRMWSGLDPAVGDVP